MKMKSVVLGLTAAVAMAANAGAKFVSSGDTLVFMGDSITEFGVCRSHGYVNLVVEGLAANGIRPTWYGVGIQGNTAAQMLARFDTDVIAKNPTVVTISAGVNDTCQGIPFATFRQNELDMVAKVKKAGAKCMMLSPTTHGFAPEDVVTDSLNQFVNGVEKIAADGNLAYARTGETYQHWAQDADSPCLFDGKKGTCADGVHMSPVGDRQMARAVLLGFGLNNDELSVAEAAWNADTTLVPLVAQDSDASTWNVSLTATESQVVSSQRLGAVIARGAASLAADPSVEAEAGGASQVLTVSRTSDHVGYKTYDQLIIAASKLGIDVQTAMKYAILRGARNDATLEPSAPVVKLNGVHSGSTKATFDVTIASVGATAGSCDVFLKLGTSEGALGPSRRVIVGESETFEYLHEGLAPNTTYHYALTFVNNATTSKRVSLCGSFKTLAAGPVQPSGDDDTAALQSAIDAAVAAQGTVTLAGGVFNVYQELMVTGGVKLVGQGMAKTRIKQCGLNRVITLKGGSRLEDLTVTGGKTSDSWAHGVGVYVADGTVSRCRICRNRSSGYNCYGVGVYFEKGAIEHSVIADNQGTGTGSGGGIASYNVYGTIDIDSCLICGNSRTGSGGGISFVMGDPTVTIRNTTIAGNSSGSTAGGLNLGTSKIKLVNCLAAGNTAASGDADLVGTPATGSSNNVTGGTPKFVDAANGDFHLAGDYAAAIRKGVTYAGIGVDLEKVTFAATPSIGCYEYVDDGQHGE